MSSQWERLKYFLTELSQEDILLWLDEYQDLGPLPGILLPMLESILPILPLFLFVAGNAAAYGFFWGVLFSWIGTALGSIIVFHIVRKFGQQRFIRFIAKHHKTQSLLTWVERKGFGFLFLLYCFPFTPSSLINVVSGLSKVSPFTFILAVSLGKLVMVFFISYIGHDFFSIIHEPVKMIIIGSVIVVLWLLGKILERKLHKPLREDGEKVPR
ncbi:TVP38/TMEM64 family protein [Alkalihalobacillus sp. AL-G]|uniref:TVP38/TMEM64 family protein n=1 Tax=Alkalihalobacillus sp. AL-G TaxID=2926399 RepID=UPI00272C6146|nr:TVP38/TMEM64 family protein [Alkalihalobacillus sp. AL-G]WLD94825.1 TVP38/TMEM64 family protein [Alkalihalobacillus sp. AL-G]